jgi:hypothetical protein
MNCRARLNPAAPFAALNDFLTNRCGKSGFNRPRMPARPPARQFCSETLVRRMVE